jgi:hypothetical protein
MRFTYKGFTVEATTDYSLGRFWACAQIMRTVAGTGSEESIVDKPDIGCFIVEKLAMNCAVEWATKWIDSNAS